MRYRGYFFLIVLFVASLVLVAGCTAPTTSPASTAPVATASQPAAQQPVSTAGQTIAPSAPAATGIDTTINVHYNDYACFDLQKGLGVDYLFEDQKYTVWVGLPTNGRASVNALVLDTEDKMKMGNVPPKFNEVSKLWVYDGLVPLLQFNDITTPQQKTITIKRQGQFYLCIDDRKETGGSDVTLQVPIKFTPA